MFEVKDSFIWHWKLKTLTTTEVIDLLLEQPSSVNGPNFDYIKLYKATSRKLTFSVGDKALKLRLKASPRTYCTLKKFLEFTKSKSVKWILNIVYWKVLFVACPTCPCRDRCCTK